MAKASKISKVKKKVKQAKKIIAGVTILAKLSLL